ncbi:Membrane-bound metal-dependent hydrolase YbcI, DUF457 family [Maribacter dokdonensis]|uniref:Membrane-bound metal-dependent hydrolase YbcI, DUF457 family n=1 Tax=Maribacter dokdonensis TaxID=320912 RepID=A0A1H4WSW9_9FLAO|nr:metal-dependent hydrolase [Maribacter dokdonensis]SEC96325.1 Membrane-bound metal-dependent hydrolase YbcI, DUF457 family [Maribacter dokdonensis]
MTFPNHVAGGIVFTGTFCSLFNVNIFDNPYSIALTVFASILPDIDHTKSLIGKLFFPISKWLSVKFGHRTITHSLLFFIASTIIFLFSEKIFLSSSTYTLIFSFALLSHLVLDMLTVQGIPLFYPFARNPCVIPANPDLRINSGNIKSEGIALFIFTGMALFMQPLFANGFWTTYNNQFNSIGHIFREFSNSDKALVINYDYSYYNQKITGSGVLVNATQKELNLISDNELINITSEPNTIIRELNISPSDKDLKVNQVIVQNIDIDSLTRILSNKYILESDIFSNNPVMFEGSKTSHISIEETFNPALPTLIQIDNSKQLQLLAKQETEQTKLNIEYGKKRSLEKELNDAKKTIGSASNYEREKLGKRIIEINKKLLDFEVDISKLQGIKMELANLSAETPTMFNGKLVFINY